MCQFEYVKKEMQQYEGKVPPLPKRATKFSAGYDFYSPVDVIIPANSSVLVWTNVKAKFMEDEVLILCVTSGMGKRGLMLANNLGIIDSDYYNNVNNDGNIGFRLYNFTNSDYEIKVGDKIGQGIFTKFLKVDNEAEIEKVREGGFGSTDVKSEK